MRIKLVLLGFTVLAVATTSLVGCGSNTPDTDHDHAVDEHTEHGETVEDHDADEHAGHDHSGAGSTGGHFMALGDNEYQAELLHDEKSGRVTIHLLDAAAKQPVAISEPTITLRLFLDGQFVGFDLKAVPGESNAKNASRFELVDAALSKTLAGKQPVRGRLQVTIAGKQYSANVEHEAHEHE